MAVIDSELAYAARFSLRDTRRQVAAPREITGGYGLSDPLL